MGVKKRLVSPCKFLLQRSREDPNVSHVGSLGMSR